MTRTEHYRSLKTLAREKRDEHGVTTASIGLSAMRRVYKAEGIHLDLWPYKLRRVRAAYLFDGEDAYVMVSKSLPAIPRLFAECHELKHHYVDRAAAQAAGLYCQDMWDAAPVMEIGAEIFAAEFIYPELEFLADISSQGLTRETCNVERIIAAKRSTVAPISYTFMRKRLQSLGVLDRGQFADVQWKKREEEIYGPPAYVRINRYRAGVTDAIR